MKDRDTHLTFRKEVGEMLVLTRKNNESIMIGDDIEITVLDIRGDKVRLGINCPIEIPVHRKEVWEAIQREKLPERVELESQAEIKP